MLKRWKPVESIGALGGEGVIAGELSGDPAVPDGLLTVNGVPASREIEVRDRKTRRMVSVRRSNADGTYRFPGLNPALQYDVIARDFAGDYEDVIAGAVRPHTPDLMVPVVAGDKMAAFADRFGPDVVSLLHFDTFTDQTGKVWTASGNAQIDTAQFKFGSASLLLDGGDDDIRHSSHVDFGFGTGDFTWECFVRRANSNCVIFDNRASGADVASIVTFIDTSGNLCFFRTGTVTGEGATVPAKTWTHVAWCRSWGTLRMFIGGIGVSATSMTSDMGSSRPMIIGRDVVGNADYSGHIDAVRITKGVARYTANFTPPNAPFDL